MAARLATTLALLLAGCEAVPALTFEQGDAGEAGATSDAAADGEDGADAGDGGSCPGLAPQNATCCGAIPCYGGYCNATNCAACAACKSPEICCSKNTGNAVCGSVCH